MPPRLNIFGAGRSLAFRSRPSIASRQPAQFLSASRRGYADESPKGPNQDVLGHVSEEAADMGDVTGETKPDLSQGTPVQEIFERDEESKEQAPEVIKEDMDKKEKKSWKKNGEKKEASNGSSEASNQSQSEALSENTMALRQVEAISRGGQGHKFGLPELPIPSQSNLKHRYDPLVRQVTNLLMKDGKLSRAQRNMAYILNHLRTAPAPQANPSKPLLPGSPPASHLPLNPELYLQLAIDSVAPLLKIKSLRGLAGGGAALQMPVPLGIRQRRRQAVKWILDAADKKNDRGSGKYQFAHKVADEIVSVVEGKSGAWDKRQAIHKLATSNRANLNYKSR